MKFVLYLSVILGITFLTLYFIGHFLDLGYTAPFLYLGLFLLIGIGLPLRLIEKHRSRQELKDIIKKYRQKGSSGNGTDSNSASEKSPEKKAISEYPSFREQRQGLKWGGGNIHGSAATRGSKRSFLRK